MKINYEEKLYNNKETLIEQLIKDNYTLKELNIGDNSIDETGYIELFSVLNLNISSLKVIVLDSPF